MRTRMQGLTLPELVIGLAVAAILAGVGLPAFDHLLEGMRTATTISRVTTALMAARSAAITHGVPVTVCPTVDGHSCRSDRVWEGGWMIFTDRERAAAPSPFDRVLGAFDAVPGGLAVRTSVGRSYVRYQPNGLASGTNATFRICSPRTNMVLGSVIVSNTGRARSERPARPEPCT